MSKHYDIVFRKKIVRLHIEERKTLIWLTDEYDAIIYNQILTTITKKLLNLATVHKSYSQKLSQYVTKMLDHNNSTKNIINNPISTTYIFLILSTQLSNTQAVDMFCLIVKKQKTRIEKLFPILANPFVSSFFTSYLFFLDIKTTHSTWLERTE